MTDNLVIVESPAKAKTIERFLGKEFTVKSSYGHIRDLPKKEISVDISNNFEPEYIISEDKKKVVSELKKEVKNSKTVWLASDEDREGEAIAWHLYEVLKLKDESTKRIVFHEITKEAITAAIKNPRGINRHLVDAQQARRVLDRLVGYELSPILWKKVKPALSAGRVQSVAVRLLVEREREILSFKSTSSFKVTGYFKKKENEELIKAELNKRFNSKGDAESFLQKNISASYTITDISTKPSKKSPSPPFTTSTLQQEASRKLNFSVSKTMLIAQKLYEAGIITYMRTDSVNLSNTALQSAQNLITSQFGDKYASPRKFKTKAKGAQEAHEAIRPTYLENIEIKGSNDEKRLYDLIWKRTVASQMTDALFEKTTVDIGISTTSEKYTAIGEVLKFDGFLKVYIESTDDENEETAKGLLPPLNKNEHLLADHIEATERFTHHPPRYTEASLVKKLEELGIGRPSTYAPTISTIQQRGYVVKEDRPGETRKFINIILKNGQIKFDNKSEITGAEKAKLFPMDIGMVVTDFLLEHFENILNYDFTASVEKQFDEIANGKLSWPSMIEKFYASFHKKVEEANQIKQKKTGERELGTDPVSGKPVTVKIGRYGPLAQIGSKDDEEKPRFASLLSGQLIETITLEEALQLFKLPRTIGEFENKTVVAGIGRFGPYIRHDSSFYSLNKDTDDPMSVSLERAIEIIEQKRIQAKKKEIKIFKEEPDLKVLNGRWGPYISYHKKNYRLPKNIKAENLSAEDCMKIIKESDEKKKNKQTNKK